MGRTHGTLLNESAQAVYLLTKEHEMTIEEMKAELRLLDQQVKELSDKHIALRQKIAGAQALFSVGDRVTYKGATYVWELTAVQPRWNDNEPEYIGSKIKRDGTPGVLKSRIWVPSKKQLIAA